MQCLGPRLGADPPGSDITPWLTAPHSYRSEAHTHAHTHTRHAHTQTTSPFYMHMHSIYTHFNMYTNKHSDIHTFKTSPDSCMFTRTHCVNRLSNKWLRSWRQHMCVCVRVCVCVSLCVCVCRCLNSRRRDNWRPRSRLKGRRFTTYWDRRRSYGWETLHTVVLRRGAGSGPPPPELRQLGSRCFKALPPWAGVA